MSFQFDSLLAFIEMAGHGPYVWASYIITFISIALLIYIPFKLKQQLIAQVRRQQRIEEQVMQAE